MEKVLSIYSTIFQGKVAYRKQASLEIEFSSTAQENNLIVEISLDTRVILSQPLTTKVTTLLHMFDDEPGEHELRIELKGNPQGAMLHIHHILIEGLNLRLTMEDSGTCLMDNIAHVPSEYMGRPGYQSLKFTTPIYPWLLANERKDTYYL
jgi:hypothetical protein